MVDEKINKNKLNLIIILLISLVVALVALVGLFIMKEKEAWDLSNVFNPGKEQSIALDEFVVNLKSEGRARNYLKIKVSLMCEDNEEEIIIENTAKIRDILITQFRSKTAEEMLDTEKTEEMKTEIIQKINYSINREVVKDIYFTDLVVQ